MFSQGYYFVDTYKFNFKSMEPVEMSSLYVYKITAYIL